MITQTLQVKLSLDQNLGNAWKALEDEYAGLDKASIIRLAINRLFKDIDRSPKVDIIDVFDRIKSEEKGQTEEEFFDWWNKNKNSL